MKIDATNNTPEIILDTNEGIIQVKGRYLLKYPERENFKKKVIFEISEYMKFILTNTEVNIYCQYVNTGNLKAYFEIFKTIDQYSCDEHTINYNWYYDPEDEDSLEIGRILDEQLKTSINFKEIIF